MSLAAAENAKTTPDELALADERVTLNWNQLDHRLNKIINRMLEHNFKADERIGVFAANSVEGAIAYLASLHAGISSTPINFHLTADEVAHLLKASGTKLLFVSPETIDVGVAAAAMAGVDTIVSWRSPAREGVIAIEDWLADASDAEPPTDMRPQPHLHFTSGTTGQPKAAETPPALFPRVETVAELFAALKEKAENDGLQGPCMVVSPAYHTGPLSSIRMLGGGISVVILSRFDAEAILQAIERYKVKDTLMVPTHFQRLLALPKDVRDKYDVSSMVSIVHTGAACSRDVKRRMIDWFGPILTEAYGATEAGSTNMITSEEWLKKPGSVGRTLQPFELVIVDDAGEELGANEVGNLYFRDKTGRGIVYYNDAEKTDSVHWKPGVFTLGEVGYYDEDGYLFITDRTSDMIVSGGVNIYPAEAEQVLIQHAGVADVAVVGAPNAEMGEEVKAIIVPHDPDNSPTHEELNQFCRERLANYKCPRSYEFSLDIGRNAMGKINKQQLRRRFWPTERTIGG